MYQMTNVPVMDDKRTIQVEIDGSQIIFWNASAADPDDRTNWWRITDTWIGDHIFEPEKRQWLCEMYGKDVVFALNRGIQLGYAKAQADIRNALGVKP